MGIVKSRGVRSYYFRTVPATQTMLARLSQACAKASFLSDDDIVRNPRDPVGLLIHFWSETDQHTLSMFHGALFSRPC